MLFHNSVVRGARSTVGLVASNQVLRVQPHLCLITEMYKERVLLSLFDQYHTPQFLALHDSLNPLRRCTTRPKSGSTGFLGGDNRFKISSSDSYCLSVPCT